jgi:hypothetical protein
MRKLLTLYWLVMAVFMLLLGGAQQVQAQGCIYQLGFLAIYEMIPDIVGPCRTNEMHDQNGNANQLTANGLMQWRKADNFTAFTDGYRSWVNGPCGLEERLNTQRFRWEANPEGFPLAPTICTGFPPPPAPTAPPAQSDVIINFTAERNQINEGECTTVSWSTQNISQVFFEGEGVTGVESRTVCPRSETTYTLRVVLRDGSEQVRQQTIRVNQSNVRIEFFADRTTIVRGQCTTIRWRTENISEVFFNGEGVVGNADREVCPDRMTTYRLEVVLQNGQREFREIVINVGEPR